MLNVGTVQVAFYNHGYLRLDGGSMFGSVPRPLWERKIPPDEKHRIRLATRSLLIEFDDRKVLVDVGCGSKWSEKEQKIYAFEPASEQPTSLDPLAITDVVITHLHFDHGAGLTHLDTSGKLALTYPNAEVHIQRKNYELACNPNIRERASYLTSHVEPLREAKLHLIDGAKELFPGLRVGVSDGHTEGLQYIEIEDNGELLLYPSDLIPTSAHLPLPYHMGFDMCAATLLEEKKPFLERAKEKDAIVVFEHDPQVAAVRVGLNEKGHFAIREQVA